MTNQQHQLKAPRSSCRHVCGFKPFGVSPESGAFYITGMQKTEPGFSIPDA
ncbi:hypothetical protein OU5_2299 [Pseudomonas mandelii JR-1]|uniref:Uncharacterized protein n=1 Tax=Pseudomonas mandelii JR-1 TaxID=1147786 RepID=A0A024EAL1_9PSED|nr:hypothetical protein OU5_2299 [Pseudomonas mandelii JR-1]